MQLLVLYVYVCSVVGFPFGSAGKESTCNMGDLSLIPGLGRSPGEGKGYPLQYSGLEKSMDCIIHGVAKSWTQLSGFHYAQLCLTVRDTTHCGSPSLSMGFSRQEYWSGLPFPPPGDLSNSGIKPTSPVLAGEFLNQ